MTKSQVLQDIAHLLLILCRFNAYPGFSSSLLDGIDDVIEYLGKLMLKIKYRFVGTSTYRLFFGKLPIFENLVGPSLDNRFRVVSLVLFISRNQV